MIYSIETIESGKDRGKNNVSLIGESHTLKEMTELLTNLEKIISIELITPRILFSPLKSLFN